MKLAEHGDQWQKEFLQTKGDRVLCCGRQVGKSVVCAEDAAEKATREKKKNFLIIAPTERQAFALFAKTLNYLATFHKRMIKKGKDRPTKTRIRLTNGSEIHCLPTGLSGIGIRFMTVHHLYVDEASRVPEEVWTAVTPMLLTTGGDMTLLSTPAGPVGYFADIVNNRENKFNSFTRHSVQSRDVIENRKISEFWTEWQRERALEHLDREEARMTKLQYAQEYMGKIMDDLRKLFPDALIRQCMHDDEVLNKYKKTSENYMGVDVAGTGKDKFVMFSGRKITNNLFIENEKIVIQSGLSIPEGYRKILELDLRYIHKKIYIDDGGLGAGTRDMLLEDPRTRRKTIPLNNRSKSIDFEGRQKKRILKEDLYSNLLRMMEQKKIMLRRDKETYDSLSCIQFEIDKNKNMTFKGENNHTVEALMRACWCLRVRALKPFIR